MIRRRGTPPLSALEDVDLMAKVVAGDVAAFGEFYDRYCHRAYSMAVSICGEEQGAEAVVRHAFESIWKQRADLQPERVAIAAQLLDTVRTCAVEHRRRSAPSPGTMPAIAGEARVATRERRDADRFRDMLVLLPEAQQEVITLARYGQLCHADIAAQLGLPVATVKERIRLGVEQVQRDLQQSRA
jgi:RNA polymerase sigma-70 factor (ECF subfamily)